MFTFLSGPLGQLLSFIYDFTSNYAWAIIVFTLLVKGAMFPLSIKQIRSTQRMQEIQPKLKALQEKYKNDKEQLNIKQMELYKQENVNPFAGCLPLLIQMPILFGLFAVLRNPTAYNIPAEALDQGFLWMKNLIDPDLIGNVWSGAPNFIATLPGLLPIVSAISTYYQIKMSSTAAGSNSQTNTMAMVMPLMILFFGRTFSGGIMVYWTVSNFFQIVQQLIITRITKEAK